MPRDISYKTAALLHAGHIDAVIEKLYQRGSFGAILSQGSGEWPARALICQKMKSRRQSLARAGLSDEEDVGDEAGDEPDPMAE